MELAVEADGQDLHMLLGRAPGWAMDHLIVEPMGQTSANSIAVTPNGPLGAPDPRTRGAEAAGQ